MVCSIDTKFVVILWDFLLEFSSGIHFFTKTDPCAPCYVSLPNRLRYCSATRNIFRANFMKYWNLKLNSSKGTWIFMFWRQVLGIAVRALPGTCTYDVSSTCYSNLPLMRILGGNRWWLQNLGPGPHVGNGDWYWILFHSSPDTAATVIRESFNPWDQL